MENRSPLAEAISNLPPSMIDQIPTEYNDHHKPVWERKLVKDNPHLLNHYFLERLMVLKLYGDLYVEWLYARAIKKAYIKWSFGRLELSTIQIFSFDGKEEPIIEFDEFYAMLKAAYCF